MLSHGGAPIFKTNNQKETACDLAVKNGNETLARKLESRMVFVSVFVICLYLTIIKIFKVASKNLII